MSTLREVYESSDISKGAVSMFEGGKINVQMCGAMEVMNQIENM